MVYDKGMGYVVNLLVVGAVVVLACVMWFSWRLVWSNYNKRLLALCIADIKLSEKYLKEARDDMDLIIRHRADRSGAVYQAWLRELMMANQKVGIYSSRLASLKQHAEVYRQRAGLRRGVPMFRDDVGGTDRPSHDGAEDQP